MDARYWISVVSRDHVLRGVAGGFTQVGHGTGAPLRRMSPGDWLFSYSPKTNLKGGTTLQAFTASGRIAEGDLYRVEMTPDLHPWRRDVTYEVNAGEAPISPLRERLAVIAGAKNWGMMFRRGHLEITEPDAKIIAGAMGFQLTPWPIEDGAGRPDLAFDARS